MDRKHVPEGSFLTRQVRVHPHQGQPRWRSADGRTLYEWDALHGHIEVYNRRGRALGVADAMTGEMIAPSERGRTIDV